MRTDVEVVAEPAPRGPGPAAGGGGTRLPVLRAVGALAARRTGVTGSRTGPAHVHLVGTAAGPLGGDVVRVSVLVRSGASLVLRGVAATLALPSRDGGAAHVELRVVVEDGGDLDLELQPVVVARGADLCATTAVEVAGGGRLELTEQVLLGRWGEAPGRWTGTTVADLGGRPWLRQRVALGPGAPTRDALDAPTAYLSRLSTGRPGTAPAAAASGRAVLLPLARGGALLEALGDDLAEVRRDAAALTPGLSAAGASGAALQAGARG